MNALVLTALLLAGNSAAASPAANSPAASPAASSAAASPAASSAAASPAANSPAASPAATDPADPTGEFRGARWGMTEAEVSKRFAGEIRPMQPRINLADGAVVALEIPRIDLAGQPVDARFVFSAGKLAIVSLRSPALGYVSADTYEKLAAHLAGRFGGPGEKLEEDMAGKLVQTTWRLPKGVAELKYAQGVLVLQYHPAEPGAPAAAKPAKPAK